MCKSVIFCNFRAQSLKDFLVCSTLKSYADGADVNCELKDRLSLIRVRLQVRELAFLFSLKQTN